MKRTMLVSGIVAGLILLPVAAQAACVKSNMEVVRVDETQSLITIYLRPSSTSTTIFFVRPAVNGFGELLYHAVYHRAKVTVTGDVASCPAAGSLGLLESFSITP